MLNKEDLEKRLEHYKQILCLYKQKEKDLNITIYRIERKIQQLEENLNVRFKG